MLKLADLRNKVSREHSGERGKERIKRLGKRVEGGGGHDEESSKKVLLFMTVSTQLIFWNILNEITFLISKHQLHHCSCEFILG